MHVHVQVSADILELGMASGGDTDEAAVKIEYPVHVEYCGVCSLPPEVNSRHKESSST